MYTEAGRDLQVRPIGSEQMSGTWYTQWYMDVWDTPDESVKAQHSSDVLLSQFVKVQQCLNGINGVLLVSDPCVDAVVVVQRRQVSSVRNALSIAHADMFGDAVAETSFMEAMQ